MSGAIRRVGWQERREAEAVQRKVRLGDRLLHIAAPARAADQAEPLPGTEWRELAGGACDLVVTDPAAYGRFLWGSGRR